MLADTGEPVTRELVSRILDEEVERLAARCRGRFERYYLPAKKLIATVPQRGLHRFPDTAGVRAGEMTAGIIRRVSVPPG